MGRVLKNPSLLPHPLQNPNLPPILFKDAFPKSSEGEQTRELSGMVYKDGELMQSPEELQQEVA